MPERKTQLLEVCVGEGWQHCEVDAVTLEDLRVALLSH